MHTFDINSDPVENLKYILNQYNSIGVWLSGGADSALGLYLLTLFNENTVIQPIHGHNTRRADQGQTITSDIVARNVVNKIRELLPDKSNLINDLYTFDYYKEGGQKWPFHKPIQEMLIEQNIIEMALVFPTGIPTNEVIDETQHYVEPSRYNQQPTERTPFYAIDKKWIAKKYQEHNLLESLFPLTVSCTGHGDQPCERCFWCKEKLWAFGVYDGQIPEQLLA